MARSLLAPAFFLGSVLVTGVLAQTATDGSIPTQPDAHAMQEQKKAKDPQRAEKKAAKKKVNMENKELLAFQRQLTKEQSKLNKYKGVNDTNCVNLDEECDKKVPNWSTKDCDGESDRSAKKQCDKLKSKCSKFSDRCDTAKENRAAQELIVNGAQKNVDTAEADLQTAKDALAALENGTTTSAASTTTTAAPTTTTAAPTTTTAAPTTGNSAATTETPVPLPPTPPAPSCIAPGASSLGPVPKWRASWPTDALNSGIPRVVTDAIEIASSSTVSTVSDTTRNGGHAVKHVLRRSDMSVANSKRCESKSNPGKGNKWRLISGIEKGKETFYGMSIYLGGEEAWPFEMDRGVGDILFQWKGEGKSLDGRSQPACGKQYPEGCGRRGGPKCTRGCHPFMKLVQKRKDLVLIVDQLPHVAQPQTLRLVQNIDRSQWYDIMVRVVWDTEKGEVEAKAKPASDPSWVGKQAYAYSQRNNDVWTGPTMTGNYDAYLKWGLYLPHWEEEAKGDEEDPRTPFDTRTVWHDNIAVAQTPEGVSDYDGWKAVDPSAKDCDA